jgi:hypothetical protein
MESVVRRKKAAILPRNGALMGEVGFAGEIEAR